MNEWKCVLRDDPSSLRFLLFVYRESSNGKIEFAHIGKNGSIFLTEQNRHEIGKPFLELNEMMAKQLFQGLADCLDKSGFKPMSVEKAEGTLNATKYHLEDLRKMLKLTSPKAI